MEAALWENFLRLDVPFGDWSFLSLHFFGVFLLAMEENSLKMSSFLCVLKDLFPFSLLVPPPPFHPTQDVSSAEMRIQLQA